VCLRDMAPENNALFELKIFAPRGRRREHFWGISCEKSRFYAKKILFFPILGGRAPGAPVRRNLIQNSFYDLNVNKCHGECHTRCCPSKLAVIFTGDLYKDIFLAQSIIPPFNCGNQTSIRSPILVCPLPKK
jgi:hypothetical protein